MRWFVTLTLICGCGSDGGALACGAGVDQRPIEGATHVNPPAMVTYRDNPPASGNHYPVPAPWGVFTVQREQWVHNLEHGGIVLLYNCPAGCDPDVQKLIALRGRRKADQFNEVRILITPDSLMPRKFAAIAWGWRWQGDAVDESEINCFIDARYDKAPESIP
jgi:Protein of unknown function (DUF3105)